MAQLKEINKRIASIEEITRNNRSVSISDVSMTFEGMVGFMVKWAIASIPAMVILTIIGFVFSAILGGVLGIF